LLRLTAPYYHEDSFITSDLRAWYLNHQLDHYWRRSHRGGLQVRVALTEQLQLVAYKDGYTRFSGGHLNGRTAGMTSRWDSSMPSCRTGLMNITSAAGIGYEFDWGNSEALQNTDELRLWISENKSFGKLHSRRDRQLSDRI
jgi:hypothetical protein